MKITTRRDALFAQLQTVTRAASTRSAVQALSGVQLLAGQGRRSSCAPPTWRSACASRSRARSSARAPSCCRRAWSSTSSARCPATRCRSSCAPAEQDVEIVGGSATFHIRTLRLGGLPAVPGAGGRRRVEVPGAAFVETVLKVARSASRDETRPVLTGILVSASGERAADGRDRLLPAVGQGDAARGAAGGLVRGQRAGAGAAGADADRPARERRDARACRCAPTRSCSRSAASCSPRG